MNILDEEPIRIRDCACPGTPHSESGDLVRLRPKLTAAGGAAASAVLLEYRDDPVRRSGALAEVFLVAGIGWWNLLEKGRAIPINEDTIREQIDWAGGGAELFGRTMGLYNRYLFAEAEPEESEVDETVPLATSVSSLSGPTDGSTSATPRSPNGRRAPSRSSSLTSTAATSASS